MTKQEQVKEILEVIKHCGDYTNRDCAECDYRLYGECKNKKQCEAEALYNAGYRKIQDGTVVLTNKEYDKLGLFEETVQEYKETNGQLVLVKEQKKLQKYSTDIADFIRKETAKEIFQKVVNICLKEEDFQDGTVNTQLEPLYFGIMNGCAFIRGEVKELAKHYGVEVEND